MWGKSIILTPHLSLECGNRDTQKRSMHDRSINIKWTWRNLCWWFINSGHWKRSGDVCRWWMCCLGSTVRSNKSQPFTPCSPYCPPHPASEMQLLQWPHGVSRASEETSHMSHSLTVNPTVCRWVLDEDCQTTLFFSVKYSMCRWSMYIESFLLHCISQNIILIPHTSFENWLPLSIWS